MQISEYFQLSERVKSQTAARRGIHNHPGNAAIADLKMLCEHVLEPVRAHFGRPVVISSGYRSPRLNRAIGGSSTSQHCKGQAVDFEIPGVSNVEVARWIEANIGFDQLILEFYRSGQPNSGWVHCSYHHGANRHQVMTALRKGRCTQYVKGLAA